MKKKLLIFHPIIAPYRIDFFNALSEEFETEVCLFWNNLKDQTFDYAKIEEQFKFTPKYLDKKRGPLYVGVEKELRDFKPDVVMVSEIGFSTIQVLLNKALHFAKYKVVTIVDDSYDQAVLGHHFTRAHKLAEKLLLPLVDDIICVEPRVAEHFQKIYHKGVFFPIVQSEDRVRKQYADALPISEQLVRKHELEGKKVLLFVGRMVDIKNPQGAVSAFKSVGDDDYRFVLVGSGSTLDDVKELSKDDPRIIVVGRKEGAELFAWYNIASAFILPSFVEPFGAVTNEALLAGCPVIISKLAGSQCLIESGKNGYIVDPSSQTDLASNIIRLLDNSLTIDLPVSVKGSRALESFNDSFTRLLMSLKKLIVNV